MAEIKWIKLDTGIFDNRKIKQIRTLPDGDSIIIIWLQLMCLAGTINDSGKVYFTEEIPYTEQMLSTAFGEPLHTVELALSTFKAFGMIDVIDDIIFISNWEKYQSIEGMERAKELHRIRQKNYRERKKLLTNDVTVTSQVTQSDVIDKNKKENKNKNIFIRPSIDDVESYFIEKNSTKEEASRYYDYYESNGWRVGKTAMKDWEASARNWMRNERSWKKSAMPDFDSYTEVEHPTVSINVEDLPF